MKTHLMVLTAVMAMHLTVHAAEKFQPATLPYRALCQMAQLDFSDTTGITNSNVSFKVRSKNPEVKLEDIAIYIDSRSGRIPLQISTNGIMVLPVSPQLAEENPNVIANQPQGSMTMKVTIAVGGKLPDSLMQNDQGMIRYSGLFVAEQMKRGMLHDLTEIKKHYGEPSGLDNPVVVHLQMKEEVKASAVTIHAQAGDIHITATTPGNFVMRYDPKLMSEDPWVQITPPQKWSIKTRIIDTDAEQTPAGDSLKATPDE